MAEWARVKGTLAASDEVNAALRQISDIHSALIDRHDVEGLESLARVLEALVAVPQSFTVVAGKYESDGSRNYKYVSEPFATRQEAEADLARFAGYPFAEIEG